MNETAFTSFSKDKKAWLLHTLRRPESLLPWLSRNIYHETRLDTAKQDWLFLPATIDWWKGEKSLSWRATGGNVGHGLVR